MRIEIKLLKDKADFGPEPGQIELVGSQVLTIDNDLPFLDRLQLIDAADQGRFPRAARPANHNHFSRLNAQVDII
jgi:hypothetical protein